MRRTNSWYFTKENKIILSYRVQTFKSAEINVVAIAYNMISTRNRIT